MGLAPPELWLPVWLGLDVVGVAGALLLARAGKSEAAGAPPGMTWRLLGGSLALMIFALSVFWVMKPADPAAAMAFPGLLIGVIYAVVGFWAAPRYALIGGLMFALTLIGYFLFQPWLPFWMAAASGALFLSGVWLWRR
jgi:Na+/phosphate symporter